VSSLEAQLEALQGQLREEAVVGSALRQQLVSWSTSLGAQKAVLEAPEHNEDLAKAMLLLGDLLEGQVGWMDG
jgi:hypothetical protein